MIGQTCNDILESPLTITLRSAVFRQFVLLCRRHHRTVQEDGYRVEREPDGTLQFRWPDGPRQRHLAG